MPNPNTLLSVQLLVPQRHQDFRHIPFHTSQALEALNQKSLRFLLHHSLVDIIHMHSSLLEHLPIVRLKHNIMEIKISRFA